MHAVVIFFNLYLFCKGKFLKNITPKILYCTKNIVLNKATDNNFEVNSKSISHSSGNKYLVLRTLFRTFST